MTRSVCFISRQRIVGETNGSSSYVLSIIRYLTRRGLEVHYVCPTPSVFGRWPYLYLRPEMAMLASYRIRGGVKLGRLVLNPDVRVLGRAVLALIDVFTARAGLKLPRLGRVTAPSMYTPQPLSPEDRAYLQHHAAPHADAILCDYAVTTPCIEVVGRPESPSAVIMHDLFSAFHPHIALQDELALLSRAGLVVAIQPEEAEAVAAAAPGQDIVVAPMAIAPVAHAQAGDPDRLLFVGSHTPANVEALNWFVDHVWPLLKEARPGLRLDVAGTVSRGMGPVPPRVNLLGLVPDLKSAYENAGLVISPLRSGTGLKIKLIEAMGWGKAVVATSVTTQGVHDLVSGAVRVTDDPQRFAAEILALAGDDARRREMGERGIALVREYFNEDRCYARIYDHLTGGTAAQAQPIGRARAV